MNYNELDDLSCRIHGKLLNFVSYRGRSEKEITARLVMYLNKYKLSSEDYSSLKDSLLKKLNEDGVINDEQMAKDIVRDFNLSSKPMSQGKLMKTLMLRGISRDLITSNLQDVDLEKEESDISKVFDQKIRGLSAYPVSVQKQRMYRFLLSRGYSSNIIAPLLATKF